MIRRVIRWFVNWFSTEFPPIVEPSRELVVAEPVEEPKKELVLENKYIQPINRFMHEYGATRPVVRIGCLTDFNVREIKYTVLCEDGRIYEIVRRFSTYSYSILIGVYDTVDVIAQGNLFGEADILKPFERKLVWSHKFRSEFFPVYDLEDNDRASVLENRAAYNLADKMTDEFAKSLYDLNQVNESELHIPVVFHKLWEQMDLPLDTGTELAIIKS